MSPKARAIIHISTSSKNNDSRLNHSRRMYAIIRRYAPDVVEGGANECLADLTGLRTFFKMTYAEIAEKIKKELTAEIGTRFIVRMTTVKAFSDAKSKGKKPHSVSTYKEINKLFAGSSFVAAKNRTSMRITQRRFTVPFIGKVN